MRSCPPEAVFCSKEPGIKQQHMLTGPQEGGGYGTAREWRMRCSLQRESRLPLCSGAELIFPPFHSGACWGGDWFRLTEGRRGLETTCRGEGARIRGVSEDGVGGGVTHCGRAGADETFC